MSTAVPFESVIAAWDEPLRCQQATDAGIRCRRGAYWLIDVHGCERGLACGHHARRWERANRNELRRCAYLVCTLCGRQSTRFDDTGRGNKVPHPVSTRSWRYERG